MLPIDITVTEAVVIQNFQNLTFIYLPLTENRTSVHHHGRTDGLPLHHR
jgi:hypothetical protein